MRESSVNDARKIEIHMEMIEICFLSLILGENQLQVNQKQVQNTESTTKTMKKHRREFNH